MKTKSVWKTTEPPKPGPLKLRFKYLEGLIEVDTFAWCEREKAWIQCAAGDATALYPEDGWKIIGWK